MTPNLLFVGLVVCHAVSHPNVLRIKFIQQVIIVIAKAVCFKSAERMLLMSGNWTSDKQKEGFQDVALLYGAGQRFKMTLPRVVMMPDITHGSVVIV